MAAAAMAPSQVPEATAYAMAEYLGVQLPSERYLMWIARQACVEPLPEGWSEFQDDDGNNFYFNSQSQESTYTNPLDGGRQAPRLYVYRF
eukprot:SAG11_NODE_9_length_28972_cov_81.532539_24_plen_90_part_00